MTAADTVSRVLTLVPWLLERPGASVQEAADSFGVSARTILSDLDTIGYCGLPGLGGGDLFEVDVIEGRIIVTMAEELREPLRLHPREALRLVLTGEAVASALGEDLPALRSALDRIRTAVGVPDGVRVELEEDGARWLGPVRRAIEEGRRIRLSYRGRADEAPVERTVHPWVLQVSEGTWYVQGADDPSGGVRAFRLDRIAELEVMDAAATPRPPGPLAPPVYEPRGDDVEVELELEPGARWVAETVLADEVEDLPGGARRVRFRTDALPWVRGLVLSAGGGAQVRRPPELRRQVVAEAEATLRRYDRAAG